jgi:dsRNA-specific ribonuclease
LSDEWPDHDKSFNVWIFFGKKQVGTWIWRSKKKAEEKAAEDAYEKLK